MTNSAIIKKYIKDYEELEGLGTRYIVSKIEKKYGEFTEDNLLKSLKDGLFITTAEDLLIKQLTRSIKKSLEDSVNSLLLEKIEEYYSDLDPKLKIDIEKVKKIVLENIIILAKEESKKMALISNKNGTGSTTYKVSISKEFADRLNSKEEKVNLSITTDNKIIIE